MSLIDLIERVCRFIKALYKFPKWIWDFFKNLYKFPGRVLRFLYSPKERALHISMPNGRFDYHQSRDLTRAAIEERKRKERAAEV